MEEKNMYQRKRLTKRLVIPLLAAALAVSAAGCGRSGKTEPVKVSDAFVPALDTDVEMTLYVAGVYGNFEALDAVAVAFQEYYPNIQVEYVSMSTNNSSSFTESLENRLAAGTGTDLIAHNWLNPYDDHQDFLFESFEDLNEQNIDFSAIDPAAIAYGTINDKFYALPIFIENQGLAVNASILEANSIAFPKTYEELLDCCEALVKAGYPTPLLTHERLLARCFMPYLYDGMQSGMSLDEAFDMALTRTDSLVTSGYIHPDSKDLEDTYNSMIMRFLEGDIPLMTISSTNYSGILKRQLRSDSYMEKPFDYVYIPFPATEKENFTYMERLGILSIGVNKDSEHVDYANELMRFIARDDTMAIFAEKKGSPTPTKSGFDKFPYLRDAQKAYLNEYTIAVEDTIKESFLSYRFDDPTHTAVYETRQEYLARYDLSD